MTPWSSWPLERLIYVFLGVAFLLVWMQTTLFHWRAAFRHPLMWAPVIATPLWALIGLLLGLWSPDFGPVFQIAYGLALLSGLSGTYLHLRGVGWMVGGFTLRNLAVGPPFLLPLMYAALGALGVLVYRWPGSLGAEGR